MKKNEYVENAGQGSNVCHFSDDGGFGRGRRAFCRCADAIPHDVQQLIVIDYKAMQNSAAATNLRERLMPAELKPFDEALRKSGLNENHDVEQLAFALFRTKDSGDTLTTSCMRKRSKTQRTSRNEADIGEDLNRREPLRPRPSVRRI
jgi:hypothetical protein